MEIRDLLDSPRDVLEGLCEKRCQYAYLGEGEALCKVLGKYLMYVDSRDTSIAPHLIMDGYWESWITQALCRLPKGIRCADVGANHGYFTIVLADLCGEDVFAFEPQSHLAALVARSAASNGYRKNVKIINAAVGDKEGVVRLEKPPGEPRNTGSAWCEEAPDGVPMVTLDEAVPGELGFIKIDAEGFEPRVWAGMKRHLESRPTILMEFTPSRYDDPKGFLEEMASCYPLREVDDDGNVVAVELKKLLDCEDFSMLWLEADK